MKKKMGLVLLIIIGIILVGLLQSNEVKADESNEKYSIDYLLRHYNAVTLGTKENNILTEYKQTIQGTNKGDIKNLTVEGPVLARGEYPNKVNENVDFDKMYAQVMNESQMLVDMTEYHINDYYINVDKPGIYMINNTAKSSGDYHLTDANYSDYYKVDYTTINIKNYNPNQFYVFNIMDTRAKNNYRITFVEDDSPSSTSFEDFISSDNYTGNIIFNYPNARYIYISMANGNIIAPKADIYTETKYYNSCFYDYEANNNVCKKELSLVGTVISNSITNNGNLPLNYLPNTISKKLLNETGKQHTNEVKDYSDDIYSGDYSIPTLLQNYSIISLGQKDYQTTTKFKTLNYANGSVNLFHISSQFLINGNIGIPGKKYPGCEWIDYKEVCGENHGNAIRFDLDSNKITDSYLQGVIKSGEENGANYYIKYWDTESDHRSSRNHLYIKSNTYFEDYYSYYLTAGTIGIPDNYLNFNRLYTNIVKEQSAIEEGKKDKVGEDKVVHIPIGGNYVIEDISDVKEIMFDDFEKNKDELTIVTIKNEGSINFPLISKDTGSYKGIPTNDYYGKTVANQEYEMNGLLPDEYHGNIVFNVPNANYIKLAPNAPFAGHLIAPNADVETEETQLAGCMIVNSLYAEGGSEAHFYPITVDLKCDCEGYHNLSEDMKRKFSEL